MPSRSLHEQVKKPRNKYLETRSVKKDKKKYYLTLNKKKLYRQFEFLAYHTKQYFKTNLLLVNNRIG